MSGFLSRMFSSLRGHILLQVDCQKLPTLDNLGNQIEQNKSGAKVHILRCLQVRFD